MTTTRGEGLLGVALALALLLSGTACRTRDFDGTLALARELPYERTISDSVWCERSRWRFWSKEDCVDWYRVRTQDRERVEVTVSSKRESPTGPPLLVTLADGGGRALDEARRARVSARLLTWQPESDVYYVAVRPSLEVRDQCTYQIRAHQDEPIVEEIEPLPEPVCQKERRMLLEVETASGGARTVIVEQPLGGSSLSVGTRGRLVEGDAVVAEIEVVEVYPDGNRARIGESGGRTISPRTEAEFETCEAPR